MAKPSKKTTKKNKNVKGRASQIVVVYTTTENENEAKRIGKSLTEKKLVACVNIIPVMKSIYRWKGGIEEANECVMLAKTQKRNVNQVINTIKNMHSYELPCIIVIPVIYGLEEYLNYIIAETRLEQR